MISNRLYHFPLLTTWITILNHHGIANVAGHSPDSCEHFET